MKGLVRPGAGLAAVVVFQLLFVSMVLRVLHRPVPHHAPVAVAGASPLASLVARHGGRMIRLTSVPDAAAARAAVRDERVNAAVAAGPGGEALLIETAASPGTAALGFPGTLLAVIGLVVFGDPTAGQSIATALLASPWNVVGQGLPRAAGLAAARCIIYFGGVNLSVLAVHAAAGTLLVLAAAAWRQHRPAGPTAAAQTA